MSRNWLVRTSIFKYMEGGDGLLGDIKIVDLTTFVTGGFATLMLGFQGADVIKVEKPNIGDDNRHSGPPFVEVEERKGPGITASERGESPYFWTVNYGKKSIEIDLKSEEGIEILYKLCDHADVFVQNFRPGTAERLNVGYEDIKKCREDIIYCSISAFGNSGPWSSRPGYDLLIQGTGGIMDVTGEEGGDPMKVGLPQTDLITGMWAAFGIVCALRHRERTGEGELIELSMNDAAIPWLTKQAGKVFAGGSPVRMGTKDPVLAPYQSYRTLDGYINVAWANQKLWAELCDAIGRKDLVEDGRFRQNADRVENVDELEHIFNSIFEDKSTEEWVKLLAEERQLPIGPLLSVEDAMYNEQVKSRGIISEMVREGIGKIPVINHPLNYNNAKSGFRGPPPLLGEHTEEILYEMGYTEKDIEMFREEGAIPER